jgi:hypothetical protein
MAVKRTCKLPISSKPSDPAEAAKWLAELCQQIEEHLAEYEPHETVISSKLGQWFVNAAKAGRSLELALGLRRGKGRPKKTGPGKHFQVARQAFFLSAPFRHALDLVQDLLDRWARRADVQALGGACRSRECLLLAHSGHLYLHRTCLLSGVKRNQ